MSRVLVIGDLHEPYCHPAYFAFVRDLGKQYRCNRTVFIGDVVDWHSISFHAKHPAAPGPEDEYGLARKAVKRWRKAFPKATVCIGNHDQRVIRLAETVNIPEGMLRSYKDIWDTPTWDWVDNTIIDGVYYFHGTGTSGAHPAYNSMQKHLMSVVQGHNHSASGVKWRANPERRIFGMDVGCGVDQKRMAFAYGQNQILRSILSAAVVIDGIPALHIMPCGAGEKYSRGKHARLK